MPRRLLSFLYYYCRWEIPVLRACDAVIAVSDEVASSIRRWAGIPARQVHTIYNGADTLLFRPDAAARQRTRAELGIPSHERVVLFLSHLSRQKGLHRLIQSFADLVKKHPGVRLLVVGDGEYRREAEALAARLQLRDRIVFAGRVDHDDAARYLNAADLYVLPTLRYEGLPFSLLEAMACGLPVIASAIGGIPSVVRHGSNGWLIPPDDQRELSAAMDRLLTDRRLAETLAEAAHATVTKGFSADTMVDGTIGVCAAARESRG